MFRGHLQTIHTIYGLGGVMRTQEVLMLFDALQVEHFIGRGLLGHSALLLGGLLDCDLLSEVGVHLVLVCLAGGVGLVLPTIGLYAPEIVQLLLNLVLHHFLLVGMSPLQPALYLLGIQVYAVVDVGIQTIRDVYLVLGEDTGESVVTGQGVELLRGVLATLLLDHLALGDLGLVDQVDERLDVDLLETLLLPACLQNVVFLLPRHPEYLLEGVRDVGGVFALCDCRSLVGRPPGVQEG